jgi:hypothetical protein
MLTRYAPDLLRELQRMEVAGWKGAATRPAARSW